LDLAIKDALLGRFPKKWEAVDSQPNVDQAHKSALFISQKRAKSFLSMPFQRFRMRSIQAFAWQ
jgi:hypothetical protein